MSDFMVIKPRQWDSFQHYSDRSPKWIKLHRSLLDNFEYHSMQTMTKSITPMLWLISSEHNDGNIEVNLKRLAWRLRVTEDDVSESINELINNGFFEVVQSASNLLADCYQDDSNKLDSSYQHASNTLATRYQDASLEREIELEKNRNPPIVPPCQQVVTGHRKSASKVNHADAFEKFWASYGKKIGRGAAEKSWNTATRDPATIDLILSAVPRYVSATPDLTYRKHPSTWLNQRCWLDDLPAAPNDPGVDLWELAGLPRSIR